MPKVTTIPPRKQRNHAVASQETRRIRVAAYCRVSTDTEEQATSYQAQIAHYEEVIHRNPEWVFAGIYADDGISATSTKHREQFHQMIQDCMDGKIDMLITKSISRFARNTVDCLNYIRQLKAQNIPIYFEKESINTMDAKGEVLITIMASLAQQESESLSQNVKLGMQYRFQQGKVMVNASCFLGYDKDENGDLVINPEQAETVKRIYREYLEGASCQQIARGLERDGIRTARGNTRWHDSSIRLILENEKYMGDALLQKHILWIFSRKNALKITVKCRSIMWRTIMRQLFPEHCSYRCRRKLQGVVHRWIVWADGADLVQNTVLLVCFTVLNVGNNSAESIGITEAANLWCGDV